MSIQPEHRIDLTGSGSELRYVEIVTDGGIVRVNVNLVDIRMNHRVVVVEAEPGLRWNALTRNVGMGDRAEIKLVSQEEFR